MTLKNTDKFYIEVCNKQTIDGETGTVEEKAVGSCDIKNEKVYIRYKTSEEGVQTLTTVIIDGDTATIKRSGAVSSVMVYRTGERTHFAYRMPYGTIAMEIYTKKLTSTFDENGGKLNICYTLFVQGEQYNNNTTVRVTGR